MLGYKKIFLFLLVWAGLFVGSTVLAGLVNWPPSPITGIEMNATKELHELIGYIYEWGVALGGLALFIVLIIAGVQYLTSAGKPETMRAAKDRIQSGIIGLILLLSVWLILNTISPALVTLDKLDFTITDMLFCEPGGDGDQVCKDRFGENFECSDKGYCTLNVEDFRDSFTPKSCKVLYVSSTWNTSGAFDKTPLAPDEQLAKWVSWPTADYIEEGTSISLLPELEAEEEMCTSIFTMYEGRWDKRCAGKTYTEVITVTGGEIKERKIDAPTRIKCLEHTEIKSPW